MNPGKQSSGNPSVEELLKEIRKLRLVRNTHFDVVSILREETGKRGKSGSEYILPFLDGTTASPHGMKNISNKIVL